MSTMVNRVAQALQQEMATAPFDEATSFALARAAIAAMREPTEEMIVAWIRAPGAIKRAHCFCLTKRGGSWVLRYPDTPEHF
jgi:hypothetical protein